MKNFASWLARNYQRVAALVFTIAEIILRARKVWAAA